jgi:hypothetical protein
MLDPAEKKCFYRSFLSELMIQRQHFAFLEHEFVDDESRLNAWFFIHRSGDRSDV